MNELAQPHLAFTLDHDEDDAARLFMQRYGQPPEHIIEQSGLLWLGPVPVQKADRQWEAISALAHSGIEVPL